MQKVRLQGVAPTIAWACIVRQIRDQLRHAAVALDLSPHTVARWYHVVTSVIQQKILNVRAQAAKFLAQRLQPRLPG